MSESDNGGGWIMCDHFKNASQTDDGPSFLVQYSIPPHHDHCWTDEIDIGLHRGFATIEDLNIAAQLYPTNMLARCEIMTFNEALKLQEMLDL